MKLYLGPIIAAVAAAIFLLTTKPWKHQWSQKNHPMHTAILIFLAVGFTTDTVESYLRDLQRQPALQENYARDLIVFILLTAGSLIVSAFAGTIFYRRRKKNRAPEMLPALLNVAVNVSVVVYLATFVSLGFLLSD